MIPRILHQIWVGSEVPPLYAAFHERWKALHPGWDVHLWTDVTLPSLINQELFDLAAQGAVKADIARIELLLRFGGVYVDMDIEPHRATDALWDDGSDLVLLSEGATITNSVMGAVPNNRLLGEMAAAFSQVDRDSIHSPSFDPLTTTGPVALTRIVSESQAIFDRRVRLLPSDYFVVPKARNSDIRAWAAERRYGTHHAGASWRSESIVNVVRRTRLRTRIRRFLDLGAM